MQQSLTIDLAKKVLALALYFAPLAAQGNGLPPNWESGGTAKLKLMPRTSMESGVSAAEGRDFSQYNQDWSVGIATAFPELLKLDLNYNINPDFQLSLSASPGWPFNITVEMPSDVIRSDKTNTLAATYTAFDANFRATWGPHVSFLGYWRPLGGNWLLFGGPGYRLLKLSGSAAAQLRICTVAEAVKEPPCGNDQNSLQTRNRLEVSTNIAMTSLTGTLGTGWVWEPVSQWNISLLVGAMRAFSTKTSVSVDASIIAPDGTPQEVSGALGELKVKAEQDVGAKSEVELRKFADLTLPVASLGLAYNF
ncbi:MAG: hypothetical protein NTV34_01630 [Proteobacteria bacterium]|nr:hypothetical protein [Pseudomonadota bacterium]